MSRHAHPPRRTPAPRTRRRRWLGVGPVALGLTAALALTGVASGGSDLITAGFGRAGDSCPEGTSRYEAVSRVNLGGPAVTVGGRNWSADPAQQGAPAAAAPVRGTGADELYRTQRVGSTAYQVPVPERGSYVIRLHFAEIEYSSRDRGKRVFSVNLEGGRTELRNYDIARHRGAWRAVVKKYTTRVRDAQLDIEVRGQVGEPVLNAVEVSRKLPRGTCAPTAPASGSADPGAAPTTAPPAPSESEESTAPETTAPESTVPESAEPVEDAGTPAADSAPATAPSGASVLPLAADRGRPFSASSIWNTPIGAGAAVDRNSAAMVRSITPHGNQATANLYAYGEPVYTADASTPTTKVDCTENWGSCDLEGRSMRIPADARPTSGSDGRMIIVDLVSRTACDFWQARKSGSGWSTSWGTCTDLDGDGVGPSGATGAGLNALTGTVRTFEMRSLHIPHTLSIATNNSCSGVYRYPATKTDGESSRSDCVPEGARLQLDPSIDVESIPGITRGEIAVAKALQTYGAINRDNCGSNICVQFEAPFGEADPYPAAGFSGDYYTMPHIPWTKMRVLAE